MASRANGYTVGNIEDLLREGGVDTTLPRANQFHADIQRAKDQSSLRSARLSRRLFGHRMEEWVETLDKPKNQESKPLGMVRDSPAPNGRGQDMPRWPANAVRSMHIGIGCNRATAKSIPGIVWFFLPTRAFSSAATGRSDLNNEPASR